MDDLRSKRVTVAGLGCFGGGTAVTKWLVGQGAKVLVTDKADAEKLADSVKQLAGLDVQFHLGGHLRDHFEKCDLVVTSPAVPPSNEFIQAARAAGVPVTTEIRLFLERCPAPVIAVTGTKGKSTTTAILGKMLESTKKKIWVGGNIGRSLLPDLEHITADDLVVLELSSFMLEYLEEMRWSPHIAVVTMLAVDHVDWHGSPEAYLDAKKNILRFQQPQDYAVLSKDVLHADDFARATPAQLKWVGVDARPFNLKVPGEHNQFNAQAAYAAASLLGVTWEQAQRAIADFIGLPHRLQLVHELDGVRYYNDSIATIPEAAVAALESFEPRTVIQIVGGSDKGLDFHHMCSAMSARAKAVLCIGQTGAAIAATMERIGKKGHALVRECGDLPAAMHCARTLAQSGDVVLLSTGCASYGQFAHFQERGEMFTRLASQSG